MPETICFNASKGEKFTPSSGFKKLARRLKSHYRITDNKDVLCAETFNEVDLMIFGGPDQDFTGAECEVVDQFIANGGSVLFFPCCQNMRERDPPNTNFLLESHGIACNDDSVVRTVYKRNYTHPAELCVDDGIVNRGITKAVQAKLEALGKNAPSSLSFVYPHGCTLNVQQPGVAILASGYVSFPLNRPLGAVRECPNPNARLGVIGAPEMFSDRYLEKEHNWVLCETLIQWLLVKESFELHNIDAAQPDINDYLHVPDTGSLSNKPKSSLQEANELPQDFTQLFDDELFKFDTNLIPEAVALRKLLRMGEKPLDLITPQFELVQPALTPAVFPVIMKEPQAPPLELFDLDSDFASERNRLAQLTNRCKLEDLEYYITEAAQIVEPNEQMDRNGENAAEDCKKCIFHMMSQIVNWRKLHHSSQDNDIPQGVPQMMGGMMGGDMYGQDPNMMQYGQDMMMMPQGMQQQDFRPDTAAAIAAVQQQFIPSDGSSDFRPDTAAALQAVQQQSMMHHGGNQGDFRPDTAAAIAAVQQAGHI